MKHTKKLKRLIEPVEPEALEKEISQTYPEHLEKDKEVDVWFNVAYFDAKKGNVFGMESAIVQSLKLVDQKYNDNPYLGLFRGVLSLGYSNGIRKYKNITTSDDVKKVRELQIKQELLNDLDLQKDLRDFITLDYHGVCEYATEKMRNRSLWSTIFLAVKKYMT